MPSILIADSGATKCEWCFIDEKEQTKIITSGISPYFTDKEEIKKIIQLEVSANLKHPAEAVYFYGTGLGNPTNIQLMNELLKSIFPAARIFTGTDMLAAARALAQQDKGVVNILGTGSNCCFYNGKKITKNRPALGYVLGDEGSGAYLGKRVIQYYLYETFDEELTRAFDLRFHTTKDEILEKVYKQPQASRYLAGFAYFLAENRGHYMVENILEDGLNDFFFKHISRLRESWIYPLNFIGSVADGFKDVIKNLCDDYEFELGKVLKQPMPGLINYHLTAGDQ